MCWMSYRSDKTVPIFAFRRGETRTVFMVMIRESYSFRSPIFCFCPRSVCCPPIFSITLFLYADCFSFAQVAWNDDSNPAQGFKYLYLSPEDYGALEEGTVNTREVVVDGEKRYELTDIIGQVRVNVMNVSALAYRGRVKCV